MPADHDPQPLATYLLDVNEVLETCRDVPDCLAWATGFLVGTIKAHLRSGCERAALQHAVWLVDALVARAYERERAR
jgi:hypothetical protein